MNTPVQGTASDFLIASLIQTVDWLESDAVPAKLVLPVHDQLLLEVERAAVPEVAYRVREIMEGHDSQGVPVVVDTDWGEQWGSLERYA